jgi:hypothetical protein
MWKEGWRGIYPAPPSLFLRQAKFAAVPGKNFRIPAGNAGHFRRREFSAGT